MRERRETKMAVSDIPSGGGRLPLCLQLACVNQGCLLGGAFEHRLYTYSASRNGWGEDYSFMS